MPKKFRLPSPALVLAVLALFVALAGTAGAVTAVVVPLAKRALVADDARKLQGRSAQALIQAAAQLPGPASSAAALVSQKTASDSVGARSMKTVTASCDGGKKAIAGGWSADGDVLELGNHANSDASWQYELLNIGDSSSNVSVFVVCLG
jgi:hypothetical protein